MHIRRRLFGLLLGLILAALGACIKDPDTVGASSNAHRHPILRPVVERLELAREIAWSKFHSGVPVHDPEREATLLARIVEQAKETGVDPARAENFFRAQIEASRLAQEEWIARWKNSPETRPAHPPRDLRTEIRPALDALTPRILAALPWTAREDVANVLAYDLALAGFSRDVARLAASPLLR